MVWSSPASALTGVGITVIKDISVKPPSLETNRISTTPSEIAVTVPLSSTVAIASFSDTHTPD